MIVLKVEDYCQNCDEFRVEVEEGHNKNFEKLYTVICKYRYRCLNIADAINKRHKEESK